MEENKTMEMEIQEVLTGEVVESNDFGLEETRSDKNAILIGAGVIAVAGLGLYFGKKVIDKAAGKMTAKILSKHAERVAKRNGMDIDGDIKDFEDEVSEVED